MVLEQILKQCGDDLSRENIIRQAKSLKNLVLPTALTGVRLNTSESNNMIWTQLQLQRWTGTRWEQFGDILDANSE
jgi:branched-chain amino acid transport system substrate-binding protein